MDIIFHDHHATVSQAVRDRAAAGARKLAARLDRAVDAVVRFEEDGPMRRVEIILHAPRHTELVATGEGRDFGLAVSAALGALKGQLGDGRRGARPRTGGSGTGSSAA